MYRIEEQDVSSLIMATGSLKLGDGMVELQEKPCAAQYNAIQLKDSGCMCHLENCQSHSDNGNGPGNLRGYCIAPSWAVGGGFLHPPTLMGSNRVWLGPCNLNAQ